MLNDGDADNIYCSKTDRGGDPGDKVVLVGGRDSADTIEFCPQPTTQRHLPISVRMMLVLAKVTSLWPNG